MGAAKQLILGIEPMQEIWKDAIGYEGYYQVSNLGRVKSLSRKISCHKTHFRTIKEKVLKSVLGDRYYVVTINCSGKGKEPITRSVHQLVAEAFLNHKRNGNKIVIDHIDNDRSNNCLSNLQIVTARENVIKDIKPSFSKYTGVSFNNPYGKWASNISINNKSLCLGYFDSELEAHKAYQDKLKGIK